MIGETEDPAIVLNNASTLLRNFLEFDNFATLILEAETAHIEIFPDFGNDDSALQSIVSCLFDRIPQVMKDSVRNLTVQGRPHRMNTVLDRNVGCAISELATAKKVYGYAGIFGTIPVGTQEELIFNRFCSHIALILEKISLFNEVKKLSIHDGLTGVFNHVYSLDVVDLETARAKRYGVAFSIILVDVDDFKDVNDTYGHLAGDFILRGMARVLEQTLREIDVIGRYGGEEFIIILPQTDSEAAVNAAERLRFAVEAERFLYDGRLIRITISVGVATYQDGRDTQLLIKKADDALYRAKKEGKNRICYEQ
ncbi:MAG TPA: GGDEF domain-containing protein [Syntrophorhabdaceae bacterium]|nr:GGDEF domain-containing protein [Syntrophorhabdaceae bacterium]